MIEQKETFISMLQKMYWIEGQMEDLGIWEARIEMMGEEKEALETLSIDSNRHRTMLRKWMEAGNIPIPQKTPMGLPEKGFDFTDMSAPEIFKYLIKYEILAKDTYKTMINTDPSVLMDLYPDQNKREELLLDIRQIMEDEERHESICNQKIGGFQNIVVNTL